MNTSTRESRAEESRLRCPTLRDIFWGPFANRFRQLRQWRKQGMLGAALQAYRRPSMRFETLEPRLLLSADLTHTAAAGVAIDATLKVDDIGGAPILRLLDNQSSTILDERLVDQDIDVSVIGNDGNDRLAIGFDRAALAHQIRIMFEGGAGGEDEFIGPDRANTWRLHAPWAGTLDEISFTGVERVQGGAAEDIFVVLDSSAAAALDGGAGSDALIAADTSNEWTIDGTDSGTLNGQNFADIESLAGGAGEDTFTFASDGQVSGTIRGGAGSDTLVAADGDNTWVISGEDAGTLNGKVFAEIENLTGGAGNDTFVFAGGSISGIIDGGAGINTFDYSSRGDSVTVDIGAGQASDVGAMANVTNVIGGAGADTVVGSDDDNTWTVSGAGAGSVGSVSFEAIENITGGSGSDRFVFTDGGDLAGVVTGGLGEDYLSGPDQPSTWTVTDPNAGTVNDIAFAGIENLLGGAGSDVFVLMAAGGLSGTIAGGEGVDRLRGPERKTVWRFSGQGSGSAGGTKFTGLESLEGGGDEDTLAGPAEDSTWTIDGPNSGNVGGVSFSGMENLEGAADNADTFVFAANGSLSGSVEGGAGGFDAVELDGGVFDTVTFAATNADSGTISRDGDVISYSGMEPLVAPTITAANVEIFFDDVVQTISIEDDGNLANGLFRVTSTGSENVEMIPVPTASLIVHGGSALDTIIIEQLDNAFSVNNPTVTIDAGDGDDDITVNAKTGAGTYTINGQGGTNTIRASRDANMSLTNAELTVGADIFALSGIQTAILTGGASANTFTVSGWSGSGSLSGGGSNDIVVATKDRNFTLTGGLLSASDGMSLTVASIEEATLAGGASENIFTLNGWSGSANLSGLLGNDTYAFGPGGFGTVTIDGASDQDTDTLDFTALGVTPGLTVTKTLIDHDTITGAGGIITQTGVIADEIDVALTSPDATMTVEGALNDLLDFVRQMKEAEDAAGKLQALRNQLPLLDREQPAGLADVVALTDAFEKFVADATGAISNEAKLSDIVDALDGFSFTNLPAPLNDLTLVVTTSYRGEDPDVVGGVNNRLEALLDFELKAKASKEYDIDLGESAENTGVGIDATITAEGTLDAKFSIGLSTEATPTAFLVPGATFELEVAATAALTDGTPINLSFLELAVDGSGELKLGGKLVLDLLDNDGLADSRIDPASFLPELVHVNTPIGTLSGGAFLESTVNVEVVEGLEVDGEDLSDLPAGDVAFLISISGDAFGDASTGAVQITPDIKATTSDGSILDLLDFSNISPSEILGMLQQVSDLLNGISGNPFLATPIPFTDLTLGDVLDFGKGFKQSVIDPLFKSGDSLKPDNNGDGAVDAKDLNFSSIQQLGERLTGLSLGSGGGPSNFRLTPQYISGADVSVRAKTVGDEQVQLVTVLNAKGGDFKLRLDNSTTDATTAAIAFNAPADDVKTALNNALAAAGSAITVSSVSVSPKGDSGRVYEVTFASDPEALLLEIIKDGSTKTLESAGNKELTLRIEYTPSFGFGEARVATELDGGSGIDEKQTITVNAVASPAGDGLEDTFQLGLRLEPNSPLLFTSDIAWNATRAEVESALERLGVKLTDLSAVTNAQTLTLRNTAGGDFTLSQGANTTGVIGFDVDVVGLNQALIAAGIDATATADGNAFVLTPTGDALTLGTVRSLRSGDASPTPVDVSVTKDGKVYTVVFNGAGLAGTNIPQMVSDSSELLGALRLDFGTSLGDLASLKTEGALSALANLTTGITFGLDLNPSQDLAIAPVVFAPGPKVEVRTIDQGDGSVAERQEVTIRNANAGTFTLTLPGGSGKTTTDPVDLVSGNLQTELNELGAFSDAAKNVSVSKAVDAATGTVVYTITFAAASGNVPELEAVTTLLQGAANNGRLAGTDSATFTFELFNRSFDLAGGGVVRNIAEQSLGSFSITVPGDSGNTSLSDLGDDVALQINGALKAFALGFYDTATGELSTGAIAVGSSKTATGTPLDQLRSDLDFTLEITQKVDAGSFDSTSPTNDTSTTLNRDGGFSKVKVGDQVWNVTDGSQTTVKAIGETTLTIGALTGGTTNTWTDGDNYEIRRPTEAAGRLRAVDMLDQSSDVVVAPVGPLSNGVQTVTILDGAQGTFVLGLGSLLTRDIAVDAPVDRPSAAVIPGGSDTVQELIIERAEDGTFDLTLGAKSAVSIAFDISAAALKTRLASAFGVSDVMRAEAGDTVTYTITFADNPGALFTVDDTKLRGSSIEEALAGFDVQSVSETLIGADRQITIVFNPAPDELLRAGNGTLLNANGELDLTEADRILLVSDYVGPLQRAIDSALERLNRAGENAALEEAVFLDYAVAVTVDSGNLKLSVSKVADPEKGADTTAGTFELRFRSPVQVDAGGGKITLSASPVRYSTSVLEAATRIEQRIEISTDFNNPAFQQLGLLTAPTRFDGKTDDRIDLTLTAKSTGGVEETIHVIVDADSTRTSIDELIAELQAVVNANNGSFADGDIRVERADAEKEGNRIAFIGTAGKVASISMLVPDTAMGGGPNGAITELGYKEGQGDTKRGKSTEFFVEDATFQGGFSLIADDVAVTATFGFLGIRAEGEGSLGGGKFLDGSIDLGLRDPTDGGSRLTPSEIVNALGDGRILFDSGDLVAAGKTGVLDGGIGGALGFELGIAPDGFLSGLKDDLNASLEIGVGSPNWLVARPSLSDPLGFGDAKDKDGADVVGAIEFTGPGDKFTLGETAPDSGELDTTLSFVISNDGGTTESVGALKKEDTQAGASASTTQQGKAGTNEKQEIRVANASSGTFKITYDGKTSTTALLHNDTVQSMETALKELGFRVTGDADPNVSVSVADDAKTGDRVFTVEFVDNLEETNVGSLGIAEDTLARTRADLQADLQAAINAALVDLGGIALKDKIVATIDNASGEIALAGEGGFSIRGNTIEVDFTGPDFDGLLSKFKNLSFRDIIAGLRKAVEFLESLSDTDKVPELNADLPLINRSLSDLLDPAKDFLDFVDGIAADPAGSVQKLNVVLADALGFAAPLASVDVTAPAAVQTVSLDNVSAGTFTLQLGEAVTANIPLVSDAGGALDTAALETAVEDELGAITGGAVTVTVNEVPSSDVLSSNLTLTITFDSSQDPLVVDASRLIALDILSLDLDDPNNPILDIDFGFGVGVNLSRPFDLDLADAIAQLGLPDFLTNIVGVDASGSLAVDAGVDLNLAFGFDLTGNDRAMFIRTADTGITARAQAVGTELEFSAKLGPFGLFVVDGEAGVNGLIDVGLVDGDGDGRLVLVGLSDGVTNDFGHLSDFFDTSGIDIELAGAAVLPLFIGTEDSKLALDFNDADGPGDDNFLVATFDAVEIFRGGAGNGISIDFASVTENLASSIDSNTLKQKIEGLDIPGGVASVSAPVIVNGDKVYTVTFNQPEEPLIATSAAGGLFVTVNATLDGNGKAATQEIVIKNNESGTFRLATPQGIPDFLANPQLPGLFALLSDPAVVIDGLDRLLLTLQEALNGQIMGAELPFVGNLLADNPAANIIGDFRDDLLKPLAKTIRENNLNLDGLIDLIQNTLFDVLGPAGPFASFGGLLKDSADPGNDITADDIVVVFLDENGNSGPGVNALNAQALQLDFDIGKSETFMAPEIEFDLGVSALGIEVDLQPRINIDFNLHIGFGVDQNDGFYFVTHFDREAGDPDGTPGKGELDDELRLDIVVDFGSTQLDRKSATGRLVVLSLMVTDGVDTDGDGELEFSNLFLGGGVDLVDPGDDGRLTFTEMTSGSLSDIFVAGVSGGAELRLEGEVDFSTLDPSLANVLPSISTDILVDFSIDAAPGTGVTVNPPEVAFLDVTLDLGSFISEFAGPVLEAVGDVLGPLDWLIGPDGFLNKRIPLLSDLLGKTVTGKDLIVLYDPQNGPKVVAFLDFVEQIYFLTELVTDAAAQAKDGSIMINFGDVVLFDNPSGGLDLSEGAGIVDQAFDIGLPNVSDLRDLQNLKNAEVPSAPKTPDLPKATGSKTSEFTKGVTKPGSINFPILKPENVFKLMMGQTVSLVEINLPELGFEFFYRQLIPIWGPIVGIFSGKVGGTLNLGFGYDTFGLEQFLVTDNPANLINGFFLNDLDPITGFDRPEAELNAEIAIGAGLSLGFITAGVEGGIGADIDFNLADLNDDGKVRFDELAGNIVANSFNPLAIFDIGGKFDLFLRAFYEINLGLFSISDSWEFLRVTLFSFDIPFERPSILAVQNGDTLTLNVGPNAEGRLQGDTRDIGERVTVETKSDGSVIVYSSQFNVSRTVASINPFVGVKTIIADGGAGNDVIDLSGVTDGNITLEIRGGEGNDELKGGAFSDMLFGDGGNDVIEGGDGDDEIHGGDGNDVLRGQNGADQLFGENGGDLLEGGLGADRLDSGAGDDTLNGGGGDDFYVLKSAGSLIFISGGGDGLDILDFRDKSENVSFFLRGGQALAGWGARTGEFTNPLNTPALGDWLEDFEHMVVTTSLADLSAVYGGRGADTFHVYQTRDDDIVTLLDGREASDTFIFYADDGTPVDAFVSDNGNDWDLRNVIEVRGTGIAEDVTVTENDITVLNPVMDAAGVHQIIRYESPAVDENLLQIKVKSLGGRDRVNVTSTSITVPVKVFAGGGDDTLIVGDGVVDNIKAVSQPGVGQPFGLGPLVLIGEEGHDTVIIDDSLDSDGNDTGYLTSFLETREGDVQVEVGVVNDLGMTLNRLVDVVIADDEFELPGAPVDLAYELEEDADTVFVDVVDENGVIVNTIAGLGAGGLNTVAFDGTDFAGDPLPDGTYSYKVRAFKLTPGRVEFEGFEAVDVRLGLGDDTFEVGVADIFDQLPLNRQDIFDGLTHTIEGMTAISGGGGMDTIGVKATNTLDRDALNTALGVVSATTLTPGVDDTTNEIQKVFVNAEVGTFTLKYRFQETAPIAFDAAESEVKEALEKLFIIGAGNVDVAKDADGFTIEFVNDLGLADVAQLQARVTPLVVFGRAGSDVLLVEAVNQDMFFLGGGDDDVVQLNFDIDAKVPLTSNGVNAEVTLDGGNESDTYNIGLIGGTTHSLINVFDSGGPGTDVLNLTGTADNDLFLLRAAAAQSGLAFVALLGTDPVETDPALLNLDSNFERVNYDIQLETINVFSEEGIDQFYIDDTRAAITIDAGDGNDFFQVGQLYKSQRTTEQAGVAPEDVFATIETTRGFLSNGISAPMTINAGEGDDEFIVFHNKAVLTANGEGGDDRFLIQAFALVGSQEDLRERTDVSGGADADFIAYAVNAPVAINGGDGFDTVVVVGTEFSDDFVVTEDGVFGAGLNVSFVNVEEVEVSGTEGDDRFFVLGTGATFATRLVGDLGSDTFFINGPTPANGVISNDLRGHSGILTHDVSSSDSTSDYDGLKAVGISANIADNDEPALIITESDGGSQVVEGDATGDSYTVVLSRAPRPDTRVKVTALPPEGLVFVEEDGTEILKDDGVTPDGVELRFDGTNWNIAQTVRFKAIADGVVEGNLSVAIQHKVSTFDVNIEPVFETRDVFETVPIFSFKPIFKTFNLGFFGSVTLLVGIQKIQTGSFQVLVGTEQVQVDEIGVEVTVSDAFTGVIEEAIGRKSDVSVQTTQKGDPEAAVDEVQTVTVNPDVGVYTLRYGLDDTAPIGFGETEDGLRTQLEALDGIGADNVEVVKSMSGADEVFTIRFIGGLAETDVEQLVARVGASLRDDQAAFPTAATDPTRPQGLRGSFVTIIDDTGNPNSVGQSRQILSNTDTLLILDQAWDALPSNQARYEILQFNGLVVPTVEVNIEDGDTPALVVWQSGGETIVAEDSASGSDTIEVSLSMAPATDEVVTVWLEGHDQLEFSGDGVMTDPDGNPYLEFNALNFGIVQQVTVSGKTDGIIEGLHRADLTLTVSSSEPASAYNGIEKTLVASVGDNNHAGVLIRESNGSTDVVEGGDDVSFTGQGTDDYTVVLTKAPAEGEIVTVTVTAQPTRTSRTGSIAGHPDSVRSFVEQLEVSLDGVNFFKSVDVRFDRDGPNQWDIPQTVYVRAIDDDIVDGGDTKVFAPTLDLANNIQGPLFILGGVGVDRSGLLEREPVMLPVSANPEFTREVNFKDSIGNVLAATEAVFPDVPATITIDPDDPDLLNFLGVATPAEIDLEDLNDVALEITRGPGKNKVRFIENADYDGEGNLLLTLNKAWDNPLTPPGVPDATSQYALFDANPNFFVIEDNQTDILILNDTDNVTSFADTAFAAGRLFFDDSFGFVGQRITGLGMGGDRTIGGRPQPGGISFQELEEVEINLGTGANEFTIEDTHDGATTLNTGRGDDIVHVKKISGHTFVNTGAGSDTVNVHNDDQALGDLMGLLTVSGDIPQASVVHLANGSPAIGDLVKAVNAIQRLTVDATGGTFTLGLGGELTGDLAFDISDEDLQIALENLPGIGDGNVAVTKAGNVYRISFVNDLGAQEVELLAVNDFNLTNGLGANDRLNIDDRGADLPTVGVLSGTTLTGLSLPQANEIQTIVVDATAGEFQLSFDGDETDVLAFNISAADLELALEGLAGTGTGNVAVTRNDDVYVVRFQGDLTNTNVSQIGVASHTLEKVVELAGGATTIVDGDVMIYTRVDGNATRPVNDVQTLTIDATGGTYTLTVFGRTTDAIAFDGSAEVVRKALQLALADDKFEEVKTDVTVDKYGNVYVIGFQGKLREINDAPGVDFMTADTDLLAGTAEIVTRMDGVNYYGFETVNIDLNSEGHVFNVQGTTSGSSGFEGIASTNVNLGDGDEQIFVSSNADLDFNSASDFEFLRGDLDGVLGAINLDTALGRHRLMVSDEAATIGDGDVRITDVMPGDLQGLAGVADIWIQGLAEGGISYRTDGNFYDGIVYWSGSGDDTIAIDGTHYRAGERTTTVLNTGLGDDHVTVNLDLPGDDTDAGDGFFVLHTMGGAETESPVDPALADGSDDPTDNDTVRAGESSLPLIIFGGLGDDDIIAGQSADVVFGDFGRVQYLDGTDLIAVFGFGGRFDLISSVIVDPTWILSRDLTLGGVDILEGGGGEDILIGGAGGNSIGDYIDGDADDDLIFGDAVQLFRRDIDPTVIGGTLGSITNPRFRTLEGTQIYTRSDLGSSTPAGEALVDDGHEDYRNQIDTDGLAPSWAEYQIVELYHASADVMANYEIQPGVFVDLSQSFGDDYIAGGAAHDTMFGQLGNDIIQGDGDIERAVGISDFNRLAQPLPLVNRAHAQRMADGRLDITPSFESPSDGDDYIEGNGGNDVVFGGLGQDDIIGGSSGLFTLMTPAQRPDGEDILFGGAGTQIDRNSVGETSDEGHARDADTILGDNGNIYRLVGVNGTPSAGFLHFNYDNYDPLLTIIPRAFELLDYTAGGDPADIGASDLVHGGPGDDVIHGMAGNDVLYGDGQDDDLYGGTGHDRIFGGSGVDGIVADDGILFTSRNGMTEPLYGLTVANSQTEISLPGPFTGAVVDITGMLRKDVNLLAWDVGGHDIVYGGLGDDWIHAGAGNDAVSGAEALPEFYDNTTPQTATPPIAYDPATQKLEFYDPDNPRLKIAGFLLNFEATDASDRKIEDGKDHLFGDLGNDWLVGGTGNDRLFGGLGDDLMNADDNLDNGTAAGRNDQPDDPEYADGDFAFGGNGLDVLIANTGNDRLFDWRGEFNSYFVPFSPFGAPTVIRQGSPQLREFLMDLGIASGSDQTLTEPNGELGLSSSGDTGGPRDPQPGNLKGRRDTQGAPEDDSGKTLTIHGSTPGSVASALIAAEAPPQGVGVVASLTSQELAPIADAVMRSWADMPAVDVAGLEDVTFRIADLQGLALGQSAGNTVLIDINGAGHGWFIDASPADSSEFTVQLDRNIVAAAGGSDAYGRMDLVTVLAHEIGHALGFAHDDANRITVMGDDLEPGVRYLLDTTGSSSAGAAPFSPSATASFGGSNPSADGGMPAFDLDPMSGGAGSTAGIDWLSSPGEGWSVRYSPYAPPAPAPTSSWNVPEFLLNLFKAKDEGQADYDSLGKTLLGKKKPR